MTPTLSETPHFFGYGSLVHRGTHAYPVRMRADLLGWRRVWRHSRHRKVAFLTATRSPGSRISGLIAAVPGADWAALDARERAYDRIRLGPLEQPDAQALDLHVYEASAQHIAAPGLRHPILLSYLDTVIGGYLAEFGQSGAEAFFETTDGWDGPVLNDRAAPLYPRAQELDAQARALVDSALATLAAQVQQPEEAGLPGEGCAL
ncbi:MAG: gamma-glutamylcyclotransferase family protein [Pseudomonadota bacterium]